MRSKTSTDPSTGRVYRSKVVRHGAECGCNKMAYSSRKMAKAAARSSSKASGELIEAYHCTRPGGHCWHLGHPPGTR